VRQSGWTLKQLLVVLAIIALLAALLFPVVQIVRYRLLEVRCRANLWAIYTKYRLIKMEHGGRWNAEAAKEFWQWINSPEGVKVLYCPLSGEEYELHAFLPYTQKDMPDPYCSPIADFSVCFRADVVATCACHTRPLRPRCGRPYVGPACQLAVLDVGDGKMEYTFTMYTKNNRTGERIWPKPGDGCPDPRWFPDVSKGY
jgi:type II secretory pathway pseudopilin PulG